MHNTIHLHNNDRVDKQCFYYMAYYILTDYLLIAGFVNTPNKFAVGYQLESMLQSVLSAYVILLCILLYCCVWHQARCGVRSKLLSNVSLMTTIAYHYADRYLCSNITFLFLLLYNFKWLTISVICRKSIPVSVKYSFYLLLS